MVVTTRRFSTYYFPLPTSHHDNEHQVRQVDMPHEGVAQALFFGSGEICETSCKDRGGKYRGQVGVTLPKI